MTGQIITDQGASQEQGSTPAAVTEPTPTISVEEFKKLQSDLENYKKEISGLNRKISEDEKALKQKEIEKLQGIERERAELELVRAEKEQIAKEASEERRGRLVDKALSDAGIPLEFAKRISGATPEDIQKDVSEFKAYIEKLVNEKKEEAVNKALAGKPPISGAIPGSKVITESQFKAMNPRDHQAFFASGGKIEG